MVISSPPEMLDWLTRNQFLSPAQAEEMRHLAPAPSDCHALCRVLIDRDWLTPFQVNQILTGKHEQLVLGSYRLRERIGEGAMGQVYKAWSLRLERVVAVKTIHKEMVKHPKAMDRFRKEMETAARLDHPHIALVRDADEVDGRPFLVLDFVDGFNLSTQVKQRGALPIVEAVEYARQAALGLQHAYERGVVHRDIKPGNLLVGTVKSGDLQPVVKILDFGLARFESERESSARLTQVGTMLGTIDYVAPEQAQSSRDADIRADIYGLGCTLFYLLTARPPFLGETVVEKLSPRVTGEPPRIGEVRSDVPAGLEAVILKMMARRPDDRYQTPIEVAEALQPFALPAPMKSASGVVMALPVAPGAAFAGAVPMAQPVLAMPVAAPAEDSAFLGMTASGREVSSAAAPPRPAIARKPVPVKAAVFAGMAAVLLSALTCAGAYFLMFPKTPEKKKGVVRITDAKWSMHDKEAVPGRPHAVLVWIDRVDCKGPVKVTLEGLPDGVKATPLLIQPNNKQGEIRFIVSFGTDPLKQDVRVVAECEQDGASDSFPLTLKVKEDPLKRKQ
ncbi:MAG: protein kinase [Planctomycetes bacterium]|nr:protein kinase [Planctomycetota bacterium]